MKDSAVSEGKILLTFAEAGALIGIGERKAHEVLPTLVTPVVLGPRCTRIVRASSTPICATCLSGIIEPYTEALTLSRIAGFARPVRKKVPKKTIS